MFLGQTKPCVVGKAQNLPPAERCCEDLVSWPYDPSSNARGPFCFPRFCADEGMFAGSGIGPVMQILGKIVPAHHCCPPLVPDQSTDKCVLPPNCYGHPCDANDRPASGEYGFGGSGNLTTNNQTTPSRTVTRTTTIIYRPVNRASAVPSVSVPANSEMTKLPQGSRQAMTETIIDMSPLNPRNAKKRRTYASFAGLGACPWNPLDCLTDTRVAQAQQELAEGHNAVLAYANMAQAVLADAQNWPPSEQRDAVLAKFQQMANDATQLVYEHTEVQNEFNHKVGLSGLNSYSGTFAKGNGNGLGILPAILVLIEAVPFIITVTALASLGVALALAWKSHYDAQVSQSQSWVEYYKNCSDILRAGGSCSQPPSGDVFGSIGMSIGTLAVVGIGVFLFIGLSK